MKLGLYEEAERDLNLALKNFEAKDETG